MRNTDFSTFIECIEPLKEEQENISQFINRVFVEYTPYRDDVPEIDIERSDNTLRKYAYGTVDIPRALAADLLKAKDEDSFAEFLENTTDSISQITYENFVKYFKIDGLNLYNLGEKVSLLFTKILKDAAIRTNKKSTPPINAKDLFKKPRIENGLLIIGNSSLPLPKSENPPVEIPDSELQLKYLPALIDAYNDAENTNLTISTMCRLKKKYRENLQEQRINFYEADCLKKFTRDTLQSDSDEFQKLLDETYDGIINTCNKNYHDGFDRLLCVLEQALVIDLNSSQLYHIPEMINNKRRIGFCHMLVNDSRIQWIDEEDEDYE